MNFADRMRQLGAAIAHSMPSIGAVETVANEGMTVLAAAVPSTAAAVAAVQALEHVGNQVADLVVQTTTTTTVPAPPVVQTAPTPIAEDAASLAASAIGASSSATVESVHARLLAIEQAFVEVLPLLSQLAGKFNL
jgi:hypothetical protein